MQNRHILFKNINPENENDYEESGASIYFGLLFNMENVTIVKRISPYIHF